MSLVEDQTQREDLGENLPPSLPADIPLDKQISTATDSLASLMLCSAPPPSSDYKRVLSHLLTCLSSASIQRENLILIQSSYQRSYSLLLSTLLRPAFVLGQIVSSPTTNDDIRGLFFPLFISPPAPPLAFPTLICQQLQSLSSPSHLGLKPDDRDEYLNLLVHITETWIETGGFRLFILDSAPLSTDSERSLSALFSLKDRFSAFLSSNKPPDEGRERLTRLIDRFDESFLCQLIPIPLVINAFEREVSSQTSIISHTQMTVCDTCASIFHKMQLRSSSLVSSGLVSKRLWNLGSLDSFTFFTVCLFSPSLLVQIAAGIIEAATTQLIPKESSFAIRLSRPFRSLTDCDRSILSALVSRILSFFRLEPSSDESESKEELSVFASSSLCAAKQKLKAVLQESIVLAFGSRSSSRALSLSPISTAVLSVLCTTPRSSFRSIEIASTLWADKILATNSPPEQIDQLSRFLVWSLESFLSFRDQFSFSTVAQAVIRNLMVGIEVRMEKSFAHQRNWGLLVAQLVARMIDPNPENHLEFEELSFLKNQMDTTDVSEDKDRNAQESADLLCAISSSLPLYSSLQENSRPEKIKEKELLAEATTPSADYRDCIWLDPSALYQPSDDLILFSDSLEPESALPTGNELISIWDSASDSDGDEDDLIPLNHFSDPPSPSTKRKGSEKKAKPKVLREALQLLRDRDNPDSVALGLQVMESLVIQMKGDISQFGREILQSLLHLSDDFQLPNFDELKTSAMIAVVMGAPEISLALFKQELAGSSCTASNHLEILETLALSAKAIRLLSSAGKSLHVPKISEVSSEPLKKSADIPFDSQRKQKERRWGAAAHPYASRSMVATKNHFVSFFSLFFYCAFDGALGLKFEQHQHQSNLSRKNSRLLPSHSSFQPAIGLKKFLPFVLSKLLRTLAVFVECNGENRNLHHQEALFDLLLLCFQLKNHSEPQVRQNACFSAAVSFRFSDPRLLCQWEMITEIQSWLSESSIHDPDPQSRELASFALSNLLSISSTAQVSHLSEKL